MRIKNDKDLMRIIKIRRNFKKVLKVMCGTMFLFGLLLIIGAVGSNEYSTSEYFEFKKQVCGGLFLIGISSLWASRLFGDDL